MAKFGIVSITGDSTPLKTFEGDLMTQDKQFVQIFKWVKIKMELVTSINLEPGFAVNKISD